MPARKGSGDWRVYVITDSHRARGRSHRAIAEAAICGGATAVQLRMKEEPARTILEAARRSARCAVPQA